MSNIWLPTYSGKQVNLADPKPDHINIDDISHALGRICRYAGHVPTFYSVAEHSVRVAHLLNQNGTSRRTVYAGLLHDAAEAYVVDIPRPLKMQPELNHYRSIEQRFQQLIRAKYDVVNVDWGLVHRADWLCSLVEIDHWFAPGMVSDCGEGEFGGEREWAAARMRELPEFGWDPTEASYQYLRWVLTWAD